MIYFARCTDNGLIKIGFSNDLERRLRKLNARKGNIELVGLIFNPGDRTDKALEMEIHARFQAYRVRGEWFSPHPDILSYIETNSQLAEYLAGIELRAQLDHNAAIAGMNRALAAI